MQLRPSAHRFHSFLIVLLAALAQSACTVDHIRHRADQGWTAVRLSPGVRAEGQSRWRIPRDGKLAVVQLALQHAKGGVDLHRPGDGAETALAQCAAGLGRVFSNVRIFAAVSSIDAARATDSSVDFIVAVKLPQAEAAETSHHVEFLTLGNWVPATNGLEVIVIDRASGATVDKVRLTMRASWWHPRSTDVGDAMARYAEDLAVRS